MMVLMANVEEEVVTIPRGDMIAVSRLLWDIGGQETTSHQHKVDCFHWAARLDHLAGLPPHPTPGPPTEEVIAFYERIRNHVDDVLRGLQNWDQP
jgi:hypothetical protein